MSRKNSIDDLIIVIYLPVGNLALSSIYNMASEASLNIKRAIPEARVIAIPINEENGRVECINPKLIDAKEWELVKEKVDTMERIVNETLSSLKPVKEDLTVKS